MRRGPALRAQTPLTLSAPELERLQGLGDRVDLAEVEEVYLPLSRLLNLYVGAAAQLHGVTRDFLGERHDRVPFVIGIAGSVAVGKSTTARILRDLLAAWPETPSVELVTTDGFLLPNAELERRGLLQRKGFPESYDRRALLRFVADVKSGRAEVSAPVYSHLTYDIVPGEQVVVRRPDVLIVEGLNVLQPPRVDAQGRSGLAVSDFFDFSIYVDAKTEDVRAGTSSASCGCAGPRSPTRRRTSTGTPALSDDEAVATARGIWARINERNLVENIRPDPRPRHPGADQGRRTTPSPGSGCASPDPVTAHPTALLSSAPLPSAETTGLG